MVKHPNIATALAAAQMAMGPALKDRVNPAFKSKYADLASVLSACLPALNENGIAMVQPTGEDEAGRYVSTVLIHETGERLECRVPLIVAKNDMQGYGSAVTYARRYGAMSMAGIAPEDDDGNAAVVAAPRRDEPAQRSAPPRDTSKEAIAYLGEASDLADLQARWNNLPTVTKAERPVIAAKDARKNFLMQAPAPADLGGDELPY